LAESVTGTVKAGVVPLAQMGLSMVGPSLERMDTMATLGLVQLETKIPVINKQPQAVSSIEILQNCIIIRMRNIIELCFFR
jgi:hypothetical protein